IITLLSFCFNVLVSFFFFFFFLMIRRPPRSTLFPTRRSSDLANPGARAGRHRGGTAARRLGAGRNSAAARPDLAGRAEAAALLRSEEHTSELQSLAYLVCRLLLEKKKKKTKVYSQQPYNKLNH